ncbi:MAG: hypothetical protein P4L81_00625 [Candidatus Pacebacteria bacterium]|nr:hypothetical protein [Candidatus Paceibacterota bacterium]
MILFIAWIALIFELLAAIAFGIIFWRLWSRSAMSRTSAILAISIYGVSCAACLLLTFFVPL